MRKFNIAPNTKTGDFRMISDEQADKWGKAIANYNANPTAENRKLMDEAYNEIKENAPKA